MPSLDKQMPPGPSVCARRLSPPRTPGGPEKESAQRKNNPTACGRGAPHLSPLPTLMPTLGFSFEQRSVATPLPLPILRHRGWLPDKSPYQSQPSTNLSKDRGKRKVWGRNNSSTSTELTSLSTHEGCCAECFTCSLSFTPHNIPLK